MNPKKKVELPVEPMKQSEEPGVNLRQAPFVDEKRILCSEFIRGKGVLGTSFLVTEKLAHRHLRKLTLGEWSSQFAAWQELPR